MPGHTVIKIYRCTMQPNCTLVKTPCRYDVYNDSSNQVTLVIRLLSDSIGENHVGLSM